MLFHWIYVHVGSSHMTKYNKSIIVRFWSAIISHLPILGSAYLQEVVFENNPKDHETWSIRCHAGIHVDFTSIFPSILRWSLKRNVKQTWTNSTFSSNESAWNAMVTCLVSCGKWSLLYKICGCLSWVGCWF